MSSAPESSAQVPPGYGRGDNISGLIVTASVLIGLHTTFFAARMISRCMKTSPPWGLDDVFSVPAFIMNVGLCIYGIVVCYYGKVGMHIDDILTVESPTGLGTAFKALFAIGIIWPLAITFPKLSILAFYLRIFPQRAFRICVYCLMAFLIGHLVAGIVAVCNICQPLRAYWDITVKGKCINFQAFYVYSMIPQIVSDVCMMVLPMPLIWNLRLGAIKKVGLTITFVVGSVSLIASCYRLYLFASGAASPGGDIIRGTAVGHIWTTVEPGMAFDASCMLSMRPLVAHVVRKLFPKRGTGSSPDRRDSGAPTTRWITPAESGRSNSGGSQEKMPEPFENEVMPSRRGSSFNGNILSFPSILYGSEHDWIEEIGCSDESERSEVRTRELLV